LIQPPPEGPNSSEAQPGPADHARARRPLVPSTAKEDEWAPQMMELLAIDELSLNPYLGCKVPLWAARRGRYRHLYSVRNQRACTSRSPMKRPRLSHGRSPSGLWVGAGRTAHRCPDYISDHQLCGPIRTGKDWYASVIVS
jgi:hypothetical protein